MKKLYVVTKQKYKDFRRTIGFIRFLNDDIYYDFGLLDGSHTSYHKDGSVWRTSPVTGKKPKKEEQRLPIKDFKGFYNMGVLVFEKSSLHLLPKVKEKYKKHKQLIVDIDKYPASYINIIPELIEPNFEIPLPEEEKALPPNADSKLFKMFTPWVHFCILGHPENLLIHADEKQMTLNHYNKRFTANEKDCEYSTEIYVDDFYNQLPRNAV